MSKVSPEIQASQQAEGQFTLSGDLVYSTVADFVEAGEALFSKSENNNIKINCSHVNRVDSAGLSLLLEWKRICQKLGKQCSFESVPKQALSMLETFKLEALLLIHYKINNNR